MVPFHNNEGNCPEALENYKKINVVILQRGGKSTSKLVVYTVKVLITDQI